MDIDVDVFQARQDFLEYVGDDFDATYSLTDKGRNTYNHLKNNHIAQLLHNNFVYYLCKKLLSFP